MSTLAIDPGTDASGWVLFAALQPFIDARDMDGLRGLCDGLQASIETALEEPGDDE